MLSPVLQCIFPMYCRTVLCLLLLSGRIEPVTGFMKAAGSSMTPSSNGGTNDVYGRSASPSKSGLWNRRDPFTRILDERRMKIASHLCSNGSIRRSRALSAAIGGEKSAASTPVDVNAQDVLDRAWRSKRRRLMQGKSKALGERFMNAFGASKPGMFVDDRDFMDSTLDNVVRVYCTHNLPSWSMPWQRLKQEQSTSTGFVIDGRRIITNAHSVEYSTMIQVRGRGSDKKYRATRYAVGEECDLAILTVEDESFWEERSPLNLGELPNLTDQVSVIGYPVGGECVSITAGVVSRVEMTMYAQAEQELLSIQIDAAINPGNSGGPVVNEDGEVVGVAFQSLEGDDVENIGYVVPVNVLEHFLEDVSRHGGQYLGFPRLGVIHQRLESPALRQSLKMSSEQTGVLVTSIEPMAPAIDTLRKGDVVMKVDGINVANDGSIPFRHGERVSLRYYMSQLFPGDKVAVELLRDRGLMFVTVSLFVSEFLCPVHFGGRPPSYFILGGLVFTVMSNPYLEAEMDEQAGGLSHLLSLAQHGRKQNKDEEIVILAQVLAHELNEGYGGLKNMQLLAFNGVRVTSLKHLARLVDGNTEPFLRFDLFPEQIIVLDAAGVPAATDQICGDNSIPAPRSANLLPPKAAPANVSGEASESNEEEGYEETGIAMDGQPLPAINGAPQPSVSETVAMLADARKRGIQGRRLDGREGSRLRSLASAAIGRLRGSILRSGVGDQRVTGRAHRDASFGSWGRQARKSKFLASSRGRRRGQSREIRRSRP